MVKNRGIEISIISQFDIRRLPEFGDPEHNNASQNNTVSCYVPIHPGSQIWFEYTIEPPHPPNAAYFFKLFVNNRVVTAWDCTEKHGYHGKTIYVLQQTEVQQIYPSASVQRKGFKFCYQEDAPEVEAGTSNECIEIRIHRIEHRRRVYDGFSARDTSLNGFLAGQLELVDGGILEAGRPQRRYKYQLLDPVDVPYAVFRFFYRTYDYLWQQNIIVTPTSSVRSNSSSSSMTWHDAPFAPMKESRETSADTRRQSSNNRAGSERPKTSSSKAIEHHQSLNANQRAQYKSRGTFIPLSDSDESLSVVVRDSIDDLPSTVTRSPEVSRNKRFSREDSTQSIESQTRQPSSPRKRFKNQLALNFDNANLSTEKRRRPLSPFTSGGILRRTPEPFLSAPATMVCFSPPIDSDTRESVESRRPEYRELRPQTSYEAVGGESSGKSLIRFLSRRMAKHE